MYAYECMSLSKHVHTYILYQDMHAYIHTYINVSEFSGTLSAHTDLYIYICICMMRAQRLLIPVMQFAVPGCVVLRG